MFPILAFVASSMVVGDGFKLGKLFKGFSTIPLFIYY